MYPHYTKHTVYFSVPSFATIYSFSFLATFDMDMDIDSYIYALHCMVCMLVDLVNHVLTWMPVRKIQP